jgi:hypothetical protein
MSTLILSGFLSTINGIAEQHFIIELDSDNRGIELPAAVDKKENTFMFKSGLNSYIGKLSKRSIENIFGLSSSSSTSIGVRFSGNFFHDEYGGIEGDIPRGSFWFRMTKLPSQYSARDVKWISFDGTSSSFTGAGKPLKIVAAYVVGEGGDNDKKMIVTHHLSHFNPATNDLILIESTIEENVLLVEDNSEVNSLLVTTKYSGKWAATQQNEKFCGSFVTTKKQQQKENEKEELVETGSFFTIVSAIDLD